MYFLLLDMLPLQLIDLFEAQGYSCPDLYVLWLVWGEIVIIWAIVSFNKGICIYNGFEQRQTFLVVFSKVALLTVSYGKLGCWQAYTTTGLPPQSHHTTGDIRTDSNGIGSPLGCYCIHRFCLPSGPCVRSAVLVGPYHLLPQSTAGPHLDRRALLLRRALPLAWAACLPHRTCISFGIFFFFHTFQCLRFM